MPNACRLKKKTKRKNRSHSKSPPPSTSPPPPPQAADPQPNPANQCFRRNFLCEIPSLFSKPVSHTRGELNIVLFNVEVLRDQVVRLNDPHRELPRKGVVNPSAQCNSVAQ